MAQITNGDRPSQRDSLAALVVGLTKGVVTALGYWQYSEAAIYLLMLLLVRPRGLFGDRIQRFE